MLVQHVGVGGWPTRVGAIEKQAVECDALPTRKLGACTVASVRCWSQMPNVDRKHDAA